MRRDMIQVYKILHGKDESLKLLFNVESTSITRRHTFELKKPFVKNKVCKHFFLAGSFVRRGRLTKKLVRFYCELSVSDNTSIAS